MDMGHIDMDEHDMVDFEENAMRAMSTAQQATLLASQNPIVKTGKQKRGPSPRSWKNKFYVLPFDGTLPTNFRPDNLRLQVHMELKYGNYFLSYFS